MFKEKYAFILLNFNGFIIVSSIDHEQLILRFTDYVFFIIIFHNKLSAEHFKLYKK